MPPRSYTTRVNIPGRVWKPNVPPTKAVFVPRSRAVWRPVSRAMHNFKFNSLGSKYNTNQPFPPKTAHKLNYVQTFKLSTGAAGIFGIEQVMRLNSLFDPDFTGVGHQPYGFDTLATIYNKYKVLRVNLRLEWTNPVADGVACGYMFTAPDAGGALQGVNLDQANERMNVRVGHLNASGSQKLVQNIRAPIHTVSGLSRLQLNADVDQYSSSMITSPARQPFLHIAAANVDNTDPVTTVMLTIKATYHCRFWQRLTLPQS